jgi:hypothetical protein
MVVGDIEADSGRAIVPESPGPQRAEPKLVWNDLLSEVDSLEVIVVEDSALKWLRSIGCRWDMPLVASCSAFFL